MPYNKIKDVIIGLEIFLKNGGDSCDAQHDILFCCQGSGRSISPQEKEELLNHGWFISGDSCTCTYSDKELPNEEDEGSPQDHELSCGGWAIFT